ncbi:GNAT family N-acetyltransferase [Nocardia sp. NBC_01503]|nr:GNAT family N-acetyltransferase [Nocardia sp. NBC_01503]
MPRHSHYHGRRTRNPPVRSQAPTTVSIARVGVARKSGRGTVRGGSPGDIPVVSRLLERALADDPLTRRLYPTESTRRARRRFESQAWLAYSLSDGIGVAENGAGVVAGCALWFGSHQSANWTVSDVVRNWRLNGWRNEQPTVYSQMRAAAQIAEHHWHLNVLGVRADMRGRGFGRDLVESGLARCHADRLPAHLETTAAENVPFYEQLGFEVTSVLDEPLIGPRTWLMRYQP